VSPPEPHHSPFARALDALQLVALSFFLAVALGGLARGAGGAGTAVAVFGSLLAATALLASRVRRSGSPAALRNLHLGWSLLVLPAVFLSIRWLTASVAPPLRRFDVPLGAMDRDWLGVDIPRWSEGFLTAPVADVFMVFYVLYFLMPAALFAALLLRGDRRRTYRAAFTVAFGVFACYMLYVIVPAAGPRHAHVNLSAPLPEGWITGRVHDFMRDWEPQPFDAFPSAHVALGVLCMAVAWPLGSRLRWSMALVAAGTAASTIVLRYHYLVDDLAGLAVIGAALAATRFLDARVARKAAAGEHGDRMVDLLGGG
jgi:membrane-associated phospholipid phosphatase